MPADDRPTGGGAPPLHSIRMYYHLNNHCWPHRSSGGRLVCGSIPKYAKHATTLAGWLTEWLHSTQPQRELLYFSPNFECELNSMGGRGRGSLWRYSEEGRIWSVLVFSSRFACLRHKGNVSIKLINLVRIHTYVCISSGRKLINSVINLATNWRPVETERSTSWSFMWLRWDIFYGRRLRRIVIIFESLQHILKKTFHYGKFNRQVLTTTHCGTRIWH